MFTGIPHYRSDSNKFKMEGSFFRLKNFSAVWIGEAINKERKHGQVFLDNLANELINSTGVN